MAAEKRGSIAFFSTYRPPVPLDIFSCPQQPMSKQDELHMTDGVSYNYNGQVIPSAALKIILKRPKLASEGKEAGKIILKRPKLASEGKEADVDSGRLSGMVFVSERGSLETLHIALRFNDNPPTVKVFSFADVFGTFNGVRMEDSGCIAGDYLVYVTTKDPRDPAKERRQPWTAVYKTNLKTGKTDRLTPPGQADLSPSVSPSGKKIAVASFRLEGGWAGEIENLKTNIYMMDVESGGVGKENKHQLVVENGGWPTWGSDNVIFFHRKDEDEDGDKGKDKGKDENKELKWGVYRYDFSTGVTSRVTPGGPDGIDARTPAAINATTVAVATIRKPSEFGDVREEDQYRHIEIFDSTRPEQNIRITRKTTPKADHFNPFVIDGGKRIGYHRCKIEDIKVPTATRSKKKLFDKLESPQPDVGLLRMSGVFPSFSKDGSKLACVDNEFKAVWVADIQDNQGLHVFCETSGPDNVFSPVWNQDPQKDILYVCMGPSFHADKTVNIFSLHVGHDGQGLSSFKQLTEGSNNNAFPSSNPDGTKLVFRSTRDGPKNLYIMHDAQAGEGGGSEITRLTSGDWTDTHCQWDPRGDWIVFSSTYDKPKDAPKDDNGLDPGYFAVYLVKWNDSSVRVRVIGSASNLAGHVNHPFFSPDGNSIVVASDLAGVSVDPTSLPLFVHSVRPYGDIFTVDIDRDDINKNKDVEKFNRITHSRYENSTCTWTMFTTSDQIAAWKQLSIDLGAYTPSCPYVHGDGGESFHMTGQLCIPKRRC